MPLYGNFFNDTIERTNYVNKMLIIWKYILLKIFFSMLFYLNNNIIFFIILRIILKL